MTTTKAKKVKVSSTGLLRPPAIEAGGTTLCLDPGKHTCGVALFVGRRMVAIDTLTVKPDAGDNEAAMPYLLAISVYGWVSYALDVHAPHRDVDRVIAEWPVIGGQTQGKDANDLLWLAACVYGVANSLGAGAPHLVHPTTWKGSVPKEIMTNRILKRFSHDSDEWALCTALEELRGTKAHHAIDAGGIGLWAWGRL